jgi:hypothetical protein
MSTTKKEQKPLSELEKYEVTKVNNINFGFFCCYSFIYLLLFVLVVLFYIFRERPEGIREISADVLEKMS